jgi:hypothetical protein
MTPYKQAVKSGSVRYFTGKPCKRGHVAERFTCNCMCVTCELDKLSARNAKIYADPALHAEHKRLKAVQGKDRSREYQRQKAGCPIPPYPEPGYCECCGRREPRGQGRWHLDHDHITGEFRGWLCSTCNTGIGHLGDTIDAIKAALKYLTREIDGVRPLN